MLVVLEWHWMSLKDPSHPDGSEIVSDHLVHRGLVSLGCFCVRGKVPESGKLQQISIFFLATSLAVSSKRLLQLLGCSPELWNTCLQAGNREHK